MNKYTSRTGVTPLASCLHVRPLVWTLRHAVQQVWCPVLPRGSCWVTGLWQFPKVITAVCAQLCLAPWE